MSKVILSNKDQINVIDRIKALSKILGIDSIDNSDFKKLGLVLPSHDLTPIRVKCFKCIKSKHKCKTFKNTRQLFCHLYSIEHDIDSMNYPPLDDCLKMIYLISFMAQQKIIGDIV